MQQTVSSKSRKSRKKRDTREANRLQDVFSAPKIPKAQKTAKQQETESIKQNGEELLTEALNYLEGRVVPGNPEGEKKQEEIGIDPVFKTLVELGHTAAYKVIRGNEWKTIIKLPPQGTPERKKLEKAFSKPSYGFFEVIHLGPNKIELTNNFYIPKALAPGSALAKQVTSSLKKIKESGDAERMLIANQCFLELKDYLCASEIQFKRAGKTELGGIFKLIGEQELSIANNLAATLEHLKKGKNIPVGLQEEKAKLMGTLAELERTLRIFVSGKDVISRIDSGIRKDAGYTFIDKMYYSEVKKDFLNTFRGFKASVLRYHGELNDLQKSRIKKMRNQIMILETFAWKADFADIKRDLRRIKSDIEYKPPKAGVGLGRREKPVRQTISGPRSAEFAESAIYAEAHPSVSHPRHIPLSQNERAKLLKSVRRRLNGISKRADAYCALMNSWLITNNDKIDSEEKLPFSKEFETLSGVAGGNARRLQKRTQDRDQLKGGPGFDREDARVSRVLEYLRRSTIKGLDGVLEGSAEQEDEFVQLLGRKHNEQILLSDDTEFTDKVAAFNSIMVLNNAVLILGGSTIVGGIVGGIGGGVPTKGVGVLPGAGAGAAFGYKAGSMILFGAALFNTSEAFVDYVQASMLEDSGASMASQDEAMAKIRASAFHLGWGIGGGVFAGAARGAASLAVARGISAGAWSALVASHALLVADDIKKGMGNPEKGIPGDPGAFMNIPKDVGFVIIGGWGAFRTLRGWKSIALPAQVARQTKGFALLGGSFRAEMASMHTGLPRALSRAVKAGYSPGWVALNSAFSLSFTLPRMQKLIKQGKYLEARDCFSEDFTKFSGDMVLFDFVIGGLPGGLRKIRLKLPTLYAKRVLWLQNNGLYRRVYAAAEKAGANVMDAEVQRELEIIAFKKWGKKLTPEYIQRALKLKGEDGFAAAKKISLDRAESWNQAKMFEHAKGRRGRIKDQKIETQMKAAMKNMSRQAALQEKALSAFQKGRKLAGRAVSPVILGAFLYHGYGSSMEELHDEEITEATSPYERLTFIDPLISDDNKGDVIPKIKKEELFHAMGIINEICEEMDVVADLPIYKQDENQRKWVLLGCSIGLLLEGKDATRENILEAAENLQEISERTGITLVYPRNSHEEGMRRGNSIATVALMSALITKFGVDEFAKMHTRFTISFERNLAEMDAEANSEIPIISIDKPAPKEKKKAFPPTAVSLSKAEKKLLLDYEIASLYVPENDPLFAGGVSARIFDFVEKRENPVELGWSLAVTITALPFNPTDEEISSEAQKAYQEIDKIMLPGEPAFRDSIEKALRNEQWKKQQKP